MSVNNELSCQYIQLKQLQVDAETNNNKFGKMMSRGHIKPSLSKKDDLDQAFNKKTDVLDIIPEDTRSCQLLNLFCCDTIKPFHCFFDF